MHKKISKVIRTPFVAKLSRLKSIRITDSKFRWPLQLDLAPGHIALDRRVVQRLTLAPVLWDLG